MINYTVKIVDIGSVIEDFNTSVFSERKTVLHTYLYLVFIILTGF